VGRKIRGVSVQGAGGGTRKHFLPGEREREKDPGRKEERGCLFWRITEGKRTKRSGKEVEKNNEKWGEQGEALIRMSGLESHLKKKKG